MTEHGIHGSGWQGGSKELVTGKYFRLLLDAGISVAAINYRYTQQAKEVDPPVKAPMHDCERAIQFLRSKAEEWD